MEDLWCENSISLRRAKCKVVGKVDNYSLALFMASLLPKFSSCTTQENLSGVREMGGWNTEYL